MVNTSVVHQKVDLQLTFHFDMRIHSELRDLSTSFQLRMLASMFRYGTVEVENWLKAFLNN